MFITDGEDFEWMVHDLARELLAANPVDVGEWQSQKVTHPAQQFLEVSNVTFQIPIPDWDRQQEWALIAGANLPWAEDHFVERVGGIPLNPPPSSEYWPFIQSGHGGHVDRDKKFSHTYPERFWPKRANPDEIMQFPNGRRAEVNVGIRYAYGDLQDVVNLLLRSPMTRQAYLPVWFPEDTGNVMGQRVPCTLGYHFIVRNDQLHCTYMIRSCDFYRHFRDDVYMAGRLMQHITEVLRENGIEFAGRLEVGSLTMHIMNLHTFAGERYRLQTQVEEGVVDNGTSTPDA